MSIIINLDVMMAKGKGTDGAGRRGGYYTGQSVYSEK